MFEATQVTLRSLLGSVCSFTKSQTLIFVLNMNENLKRKVPYLIQRLEKLYERESKIFCGELCS